MQNLYSYLIIFLGVKTVLILVFGFIIYREHSRIKKNLKTPSKNHILGEEFYLVKSSLKKVNEGFLVGQILFCNRKGLIQPAHKETPRHSPDAQD
jgi:hypothetical protein